MLTFISTRTLFAFLKFLQDKQDSLKVGRFVISKGRQFASTSEIVQCQAYTTCLLAVVVPKGCTIDQICAPKEGYKVLQRLKLVGLNTEETSNRAGAVNGTQDTVRSQASYDQGSPALENDQQACFDDDQRHLRSEPPPTAPWPVKPDQVDDQKPKPVKTPPLLHALEVPEIEMSPIDRDGDEPVDGEGLANPAIAATLQLPTHTHASGKHSTDSKNVIAAQATPLRRSLNAPDQNTGMWKQYEPEDVIMSAVNMPQAKASVQPTSDQRPHPFLAMK